MKYLILSLVLTLPCMVANAQAPQKCLLQNAHEITSLTSEDYADLRFLKDVLKDKRIVLLGESTHGVGDYYALKSRLVKFLHQEMGYELLSIESGIGDVYFQYLKIDTTTALQLRNNTVYGNFQCKEINPLFDYIKATSSTVNPLIYTGFDSQNFSAALVFIKTVLKDYIPLRADSVVNDLWKYYRIPSLMWQADNTPLFVLSDTIKRAANEAIEIFQQNKDDIKSTYGLSEIGYSIIERTLFNHRDAVSLDWNNDSPMGKRDSLMADNLIWLMENIYPDKKFIIWGHNGHMQKSGSIDDDIKWMGHFIKEKYPTQTYHLGIFAKEGETYEFWTKANKPFNNNKPDDIETLGSLFDMTFLNFDTDIKQNCSWTNEAVYGFELENNGRMHFVPTKRFDGIIVLKKVKLPQFK